MHLTSNRIYTEAAHIQPEEGEIEAKYLNMAMQVRSLLLIERAVLGYHQGGGQEHLGRTSKYMLSHEVGISFSVECLLRCR
jgi:hypothetical protein